MHCIESLTEEDLTALPESSVHVIDGNALFQGMVRLPETFDGFALFVFNSLPASETVHFVTDTYLENSVKQLERNRRGSSPHICLEEEKRGCRETSRVSYTIQRTRGN